MALIQIKQRENAGRMRVFLRGSSRLVRNKAPPSGMIPDGIHQWALMRWLAGSLLAAVLLLMAYAAWPLLGLKALADTVEARDTAALPGLLDMPELKRSLAEQVVRAYLKMSGKDRSLSPFVLNAAVQVGMSIADPIVVEIVDASALIDLLRRGRTETFAGRNIGMRAWGVPNMRNARGLFLGSEYAGRNFHVTVPLDSSPGEGYRLRLKLSGGTWKLAGIGLPEELQQSFARELMRRSPP